jgi:hypothetical protein
MAMKSASSLSEAAAVGEWSYRDSGMPQAVPTEKRIHDVGNAIL